MFNESFVKASSTKCLTHNSNLDNIQSSEDTLWACKAYQNLLCSSPKVLNAKLNVLSLFKPGEILEYVIQNSANKET